MPVTFNIEERADGIIVSVSESGSYGRVALGVFFGSFVAYLFVRFATSRAFQILICLFIAFGVVREAISSLRGTDVKLQIGNLDLTSQGHAPGGYNSSTISRATVERFEYRKASGGGDGPDFPEGLYAEWSGFGSWSSSQCILPGVTQSQADVVIEAIYRRFPDTGTLSPNRSRESDLISLNLSSIDKR
jgi:hypothetical protein